MAIQHTAEDANRMMLCWRCKTPCRHNGMKWQHERCRRCGEIYRTEGLAEVARNRMSIDYLIESVPIALGET